MTTRPAFESLSPAARKLVEEAERHDYLAFITAPEQERAAKELELAGWGKVCELDGMRWFRHCKA